MPDRDSKPALPILATEGADLLRLTRSGTDTDRAKLRLFSPEQMAGAVVQLPPDQRVEVLENAERVREIVPLLPEAEFATTVRGTGIEDAGWLVEYASSEQRVAAVDLDCWRDFRLSPRRLFEWIDAMIEAGSDTLVAAFNELDLELWILALKEMADFSVVGAECELDGLTDDGIVYYDPHPGGHEERLFEILSTARIESPSHYWAFVYGAMLESQTGCAEYAARWQRGRLGDLGFPDREQAMRAYRPLAVDAVPAIDVGEVQATRSLTTAPQLPQRLAGTLVGEALRELPPARAAEILGYVLAVANALAVADELPLSDGGSVEASFGKALRGIDRGLAELARGRDQSRSVVLDGVQPLDLFRIGATLDPSLRPSKTLAQLQEEEERSDWDVETEMIDEEDMTLAPDGRPW